jgi:hypothetical protein
MKGKLRESKRREREREREGTSTLPEQEDGRRSGEAAGSRNTRRIFQPARKGASV